MWSLLIELSTGLQSLVYTENSGGELTQPWGAPLFVVKVVEMVLLILTHCFLSVRKFQFHLRKDGITFIALSFWSSIYNALEKFKKRIRAELLGESASIYVYVIM